MWIYGLSTHPSGPEYRSQMKLDAVGSPQKECVIGVSFVGSWIGRAVMNPVSVFLPSMFEVCSLASPPDFSHLAETPIFQGC